jgi:outer membrane immunogenic protein
MNDFTTIGPPLRLPRGSAMLQKKIVSHLVLTAILALTAGMAAKAEDWTGFYAGVSAGPQFDQSKFKTSSVGPNNVFGISGNAEQKFNDGDGRIGAFAGWQMTVAPAVIAGVEGDITALVDSSNDKPGLPGISYNGATPSDTIGEKQNYDASLRGRLGTMIEPDTLVYGTAGGALRSLDVRGYCPGTGVTSWCGVSEGEIQTKTLIGWTAGIGAETKLMDKWAVRLEYRYADYGNKTLTLFSSANQGTDQVGGKVNLNSQIITLGIVYHFGGL